jgi:hypothetical protein
MPISVSGVELSRYSSTVLYSGVSVVGCTDLLRKRQLKQELHNRSVKYRLFSAANIGAKSTPPPHGNRRGFSSAVTTFPEADMADEQDWAGPRPLRLTTILSFLPAFPLCLAHGIVSHAPVPAVGLVPLAVSAAVGIALLQRRKPTHPAAICAADLVLAAGLMVVLVFTWITAPRSHHGGLSMLASYATIPLLVNLCVPSLTSISSSEPLETFANPT